MIRKLRKKLMTVLMCVMCTFLAVIFIGMLVTTVNGYESHRRSAMDMPVQEWERSENDKREDRPALPVALVTVEADGSISIQRNELYYMEDEELIAVVRTLEETAESSGTASEYELRFMRHRRGDRIFYFFTDTTLERQMLTTQLHFSAVAIVLAIVVFLVVSYYLSRWMVKPVERVWEKQHQFIADASHELKTPLTVILSNTDMLINSGAVEGEKNLKRLDNIRAESQRMKGLVEGLLTLAQSDRQPADASFTLVNISFLATSATLAMESTIYDTGRTLEMNIEDDLTVLGNEAQLHQLTEILLDNAAKYSDAESCIVLALSRQGKEAVLTVSTCGEPLSPQACRDIFERFYRLDQSRGQKKGYGLGLAIAYTIVQRHGGRIEAKSDGVHLNTFIVHIPLAQEE